MVRMFYIVKFPLSRLQACNKSHMQSLLCYITRSVRGRHVIKHIIELCFMQYTGNSPSSLCLYITLSHVIFTHFPPTTVLPCSLVG